MVRLFLVFFIVIFMNAGEFDKVFNNFDNTFSNSSTSIKKKLHKDIRDVYVKTSIDKNIQDKKEVLKRLIHSSKSLGYNYIGYENELKSLGDNYNSYLNYISKKNILDDVKKPVDKEKILLSQKPTKKPDSLKKQQSVKKEPIATKKKETPVKNNNTKKELPSLDKKRSDKNSKLMLLGVKKISGGVELKFNRTVDDSEIKKFALKGNIYRNILDIKAGNYSKVSKIENHAVEEIRIAQFDKDTTRVVFSQKGKFNISFSLKENLINIVASGKASAKTATPKKNIKPKLIVIDPGHGGKDPGATVGKLKEKDIALKIAKNLGNELSLRGYKILYTRNTDKFIPLRSRTAFANKKNADLFVSIHMNAGPNTKKGKTLSGVETFFLSPARSERSKNAAALENKGDISDMNFFSKQTYLNFLNREKIIASNKVAIDVQKHMLNRVSKKYSMKDGGVREAPFWVLVGATMPAILVECGYVTNSHDSKVIVQSKYQKDVALGIADGIDIYFSKNR
ncbi:N-acetylmuramoyl-L-alanine amidase [Campylobacter blaseri]|nr:N-acetylmuramoyl-L-alanine amidase [Campylobacter blaseri]QKF86449.1 N-acetylmuramoyl-L-alanine amidase [Campylobacter blaseri]